MRRDEILDALRDVGRHLDAQGLQGDIYVVGGAAMAIAYNRARVTRDVDAVFEPKLRIYEIAQWVADERGLPGDWLNDGVKGFLSGPDPHPTQVLELPGLRCEVASPQMLIALKVLAHRVEQDASDLRTLAGLAGLAGAEEVLDLAARLLAPRQLPLEAQLFVEETLGER